MRRVPEIPTDDFDRTLAEVRSRFADLSGAEIAALIAEASEGVRLDGLNLKALVAEGREDGTGH